MTLFGFISPCYTQAWFPLSFPLSAGGTSATDTSRPALFQNPALPSYASVPYLYTEYESRYGITELASKGLRFAYPFSHFTTTLDFRYTGFSAYHEMIGGLGFSRNFGTKFSMGLQLMVESRYSVESNRYYLALYPHWGLTVPLSDILMLGVVVMNPFQSTMKYNSEKRRLPSVYSLGLNYKFTDELCWRLQADQEISNQLRWGTAFEFEMLQCIRVQTGVHYNDFFVPELGLGFKLKKLQFDLVTTLHPQLGITLAGGLSFLL
jgi:hypothetical protein